MLNGQWWETGSLFTPHEKFCSQNSITMKCLACCCLGEMWKCTTTSLHAAFHLMRVQFFVFLWLWSFLRDIVLCALWARRYLITSNVHGLVMMSSSSMPQGKSSCFRPPKAETVVPRCFVSTTCPRPRYAAARVRSESTTLSDYTDTPLHPSTL